MYVKSPKIYFAYLLISTAARAFEAGMVASMMTQIRSSLHLTYTLEGVVAASPDLGIVPAGVIAVYLFHYFSAYRVLVTGQFCIGFSAIFAVLIPTATSLIFARALGGLFWGFAAVHYPSWINKYGGSNQTLWLGLYNAMLLVGILVGYCVGAAADTTGFVSWRHLYGFEGATMVFCGAVCIFMDPRLVQVSAIEHIQSLIIPTPCGDILVGGGDSSAPPALGCPDSGEKEALLSSPSIGPPESNATTVRSRSTGVKKNSSHSETQNIENGAGGEPVPLSVTETIGQVLSSPLYVWTVATGAILSGAICFILYFVTQALEELAFFSTKKTFILVGIIFVTSPIPGNVMGAWYLQYKGGYQNFPFALKFTVSTAIMSFIGCIMLSVSALFKLKLMYILSFYIYLATGAAPTAAINGVAVCLLPGSDIAGSGVQFSLQNIGKLVVPALGGMVIDYLGDKVVLGFQIVILACGFFAILTAIMGYQASLKHVQELAVGEPAKSMVPEERSTYTRKYDGLAEDVAAEAEESIVI